MTQPRRRTLLLVAHPALPLSKPDRVVVEAAEALPDVTVRDLYRRYQSHAVDVLAERALAAAADDIVVHFPVLHHREPALLQRWLERVFDPAWYEASGADVVFSGTRMRVTTLVEDGGQSPAVRRLQRWRVEEQILFLKRWAHRLGMRWQDPVVVPVPASPDAAALTALQDTFRCVLTTGAAVDGPSAGRRWMPRSGAAASDASA